MKNLRITVNGTAYDVQVEELGETAAPSAAPVAAPAPVKTPVTPAATPASPAGETVSAPMPGTILSIAATPGKAVKSGEVLLVLEAMKMENEIKAPHDATVAAVLVQKGESVDTGAALVTLS